MTSIGLIWQLVRLIESYKTCLRVHQRWAIFLFSELMPIRIKRLLAQYWTRYIPDWHAKHKTSFFEDRIRINIETSFFRMMILKRYLKVRIIKQDSIYPMEEWANIRETPHLSYLLFIFFEQHKKYNGKNGREKRGKHSRVLSLRVIFQKRSFFRENAWGILNI